MSVIGRRVTVTGTAAGETVGVLAENLPTSLAPFFLYPPGGTEPQYYAARHWPGSTGPAGWGAGTRWLWTVGTRDRQPLADPVPVLAVRVGQGSSGGRPLRVSPLESGVDPVLVYSHLTNQYTLFYWVNAWSPPRVGGDGSVAPSLFATVVPGGGGGVDGGYGWDAGYPGVQPGPGDVLGVRDVPAWFQPGTAPPGVSPGTGERVGPFDRDRFFVAPFTDAHLYRFPSDVDPLPAPAGYPPVVPANGPPVSPPSSGVGFVDPANFIDSLPFLRFPLTPTTYEVITALHYIREGIPLTPGLSLTLDLYINALQRIGLLARTTRVLVQATGQLQELRVDLGTESFRSWLVVGSPRVVWAAPRGTNRVLVGRQKWTAFLGSGTVFITAPLTYRYPAMGSTSLVGGESQVDFTLHGPAQRFTGSNRAGILSEAAHSQHPPWLPEQELGIPSGYGSSLVEILGNPVFW